MRLNAGAKAMQIKFYIGRMTLEAGKAKYLGGLRLAFDIVFYGKGYYRFRRKIKKLRKQRRQL